MLTCFIIYTRINRLVEGREGYGLIEYLEEEGEVYYFTQPYDVFIEIFYFVTTTMTTVGYGDNYAQTNLASLYTIMMT